MCTTLVGNIIVTTMRNAIKRAIAVWAMASAVSFISIMAVAIIAGRASMEDAIAMKMAMGI